MICVEQYDYTVQFSNDLKSVSPEVQDAAKDALKALLSNPRAGKLRLHRLSGYKPPLWKIDVFPTKSWQIAFEMRGTTAVLWRLATHKQMDRL